MSSRPVNKFAEGLPNGVVPNGVVPNGVVPNGVVPNGVVPNGVVPNGVVPNGVVPNEVVPNGVVPIAEVLIALVIIEVVPVIALIKIIKRRTNLVKKVLALKDKKNQIVDQKRIKTILKNIRKKSINNNIDPKITYKIWRNMISAYIDFEKRNFKKK